jgi:hypothetical protein
LGPSGLEHCPLVARVLLILTAVAAAVLVAGCGDDGGAGTFTDCASIGKVTTIKDPARDQEGRVPGGPDGPQGDLLAFGISRANGKLCAVFTVRGDVKPSAAYLLVLRPVRAERPVVQVEATVLASQAPHALVNTGTAGTQFRNVDATVGIDGKRISVLVERGTFAKLRVQHVFDAFRFQARTAVVTKDDGHLTDCAPACR